MRVILPAGASPVLANIAGVLESRVRERSGQQTGGRDAVSCDVHLAIEPGIGEDGFVIADAAHGGVRIAGDGERGLLYGIGKFLRNSHHTAAGFAPGTWRGRSVPDCPIRGAYLATHFRNFYEAAPAVEVERYVEDLALWGLNAILCNFPPQQFTGLDDPDARRNVEQILTVMRAAKRIGLRVGLVQAVNCGYNSAPRHLRFTQFPDDLGRRGNYGDLVCPSSPEGRGYLLKLWDDLLLEFADVGLDLFVSWPYDEGGCGCDGCWPWGARGFLDLSRDVAGLLKSRYPACKLVLSTWMYDTPAAGEWDGLSRAMDRDRGWVDYIMADAHEDFPTYPLQNPIPGDLPLLSFPEISMWGMAPWGGYGANPLPGRYQKLWNKSSERLSGGFSYSEGIYEDINKVLYLQFFWDKKRSALDILREYIASEFSPAVVDDVLHAVSIMEDNHSRDRIGESAERALELMEKANGLIPPRLRSAWRWRLLMLRARIDCEICRNGGSLAGSTLADSFGELIEIYHAQNALWSVRPPRNVGADR